MGTEASCHQACSVFQPPEGKPNATFIVPNGRFAPNEIIELQTSGAKDDDKVCWFVDGVLASEDNRFEFRPLDYRDYDVTLMLEDRFGRTASQQERITVARPAAPVAGFTIGSTEITVGNLLQMTDISSGEIESVQYSVTGRDPWTVKTTASDERNRSFSWRCDSTGSIQITQTVVGPGGTDSKTDEVAVVARWNPIAANFVPSTVSGRGDTLVRFENQSTGDAYRCLLNPRDGSESIRVDGLADLTHTFGPGQWRPEITLYPPLESGLIPVVWEAPVISIEKPYPMWVKSLAAAIPLGLLALGTLVLAPTPRCGACSDSC